MYFINIDTVNDTETNSDTNAQSQTQTETLTHRHTDRDIDTDLAPEEAGGELCLVQQVSLVDDPLGGLRLPGNTLSVHVRGARVLRLQVLYGQTQQQQALVVQ